MSKAGDFSYVRERLERQSYEDAWETIHRVPGALEYLKNKPKDQSWAFTADPAALHIMKQLSMYDMHSGASIAITMRHMEDIVKYGWLSNVATFYTSLVPGRTYTIAVTDKITEEIIKLRWPMFDNSTYCEFLKSEIKGQSTCYEPVYTAMYFKDKNDNVCEVTSQVTAFVQLQ